MSKKRFLSLCAVLLAMTLLCSGVPAQAETKAYVRSVNSGRINLRSGPSSAYEILTVISSGTPLEVKGVEGSWALVVVPDSKGNGTLEGYIYANFIDYSPVQPVQNEAAVSADGTSVIAEPTPMIVDASASGWLALRESPDKNSPSLRLIPNGTKVAASALDNGWSFVIVDNQSGYMVSRFLFPVRTSASQGKNVSANVTTVTGNDTSYYSGDSQSTAYYYRQPEVQNNTPVTSFPATPVVNNVNNNDNKDNAHKALVCMGFQLNPDGSMQQELIGRLEALKREADQNPDALIVCTGGATGQTSDTEANQMANWLIDKGVDPNRILVENQSYTTRENASNTLSLLSQVAPDTTDIRIITSDYHMNESVELFQSQAGSDVNVTAGESFTR